VLDRGFFRFAKFVGALLTIFVVIGLFFFGLDIRKVGETLKQEGETVRQQASGASLEAQKALLEVEQQKAELEAKMSQIDKAIEHVTKLESEIAGHREDVQKSADEVRRLVAEMRGYSEESNRIVVEMRVRALGTSEKQVAVAKKEERGIGIERGKLWAIGSTLTFRFIDGNDKLKDTVRDAIHEWAKYVSLTFAEVASGDAEIRISFEQPGSWSYTGTDALGVAADQPTLNYGFLADLDQDSARQTALHEFGHALGLVHEFQNPDAGDVFDLAAAKKEFSGPPNNWSDEQIRETLIDKADYPGSRPYDRRSIMNYSFPQNIFLPGKDTDPGDGLSESDKSYVATLYPKSE
jgi:Astacin (Peptidase family M12A)